MEEYKMLFIKYLAHIHREDNCYHGHTFFRYLTKHEKFVFDKLCGKADEFKVGPEGE